MKTSLHKVFKMLIIAIIYSSVTAIFAQAPTKLSYQAVIRNASNVLVANANVGIKISVLQTTATGTVVFAETHTITTNINGLATLEIGGGAVVSGNFATINWANGPYFIKTETDPTGGSNYTISGTSQFLSVPFALYAASGNPGPQGIQGEIGPQGIQGIPGSTSGTWTTTGNNIANNNSGFVGIGTGATAPSSILTVKKDGIGFTQESLSGISKIGFYTIGSSAFIQTHSDNDLLFTTNNGNTQMTLQKATGNLGIGVIAPSEKLEVSGKIKTTSLQITTNAGAGKILTSDALGNAIWTTSSNANTGILIGRVGNQTVVNNDATQIMFNSEENDPSNSFNTTTSEWTIPSTGFYHINATIAFSGITASPSGSLRLDIYKNGALFKRQSFPVNIGNIGISVDAPLIAGDVISVYTAQGTGSDKQILGQSIYSYFSGFKVY